MVGIKRSYTFSLDGSSSSSFPASDELPSCSNGYTPKKELKYEHISRDSCLNPIPSLELKPSEIVLRDDNDRLKGDFLSLAPPLPDSASPSLKRSYPFDCSGHQENMKSRILQLGPNRSTQQALSFFPLKQESDRDRTNSYERSGGGVKDESIDLDLRL